MSESMTDRDFSNINQNKTNSRNKQTSNYDQKKQITRTIHTQSIHLNREYLVSLNGMLRILIIVFQFAQWVSAASVPKIINGEYYLLEDIYQTRNACLFFSITGFLLGVIFYIVYLLNINNSSKLEEFPWSSSIFISDVLWAVSTFVIAIVCAVKEGNLKAENLILSNLINKGAFASASISAVLAFKRKSNE